ncbi:MAG: hypothetical protein NTV43_16315 [Methylococcales bacterium]|nr:hypothetical protein [Methylococcales bacterium]
MPKAKDLFSDYKFDSKEDYTKNEYAKLVFEAEKIFIEKRKFAHARWWQEDSLVNNRLTWLLTSQSFLFAGYGFIARGGPNPNCPVPEQVDALINVLPWLGLSVCIVIALAIRAAWQAQHILGDKYWEELKITIGVDDRTNSAGRMPGSLLPLIFGSCWGWLFFDFWGLLLFLSLSLTIPSCLEIWQKEGIKAEDMREFIENKNQLKSNFSSLVGRIKKHSFFCVNQVFKRLIGIFNRSAR